MFDSEHFWPPFIDDGCSSQDASLRGFQALFPRTLSSLRHTPQSFFMVRLNIWWRVCRRGRLIQAAAALVPHGPSPPRRHCCGNPAWSSREQPMVPAAPHPPSLLLSRARVLVAGLGVRGILTGTRGPDLLLCPRLPARSSFLQLWLPCRSPWLVFFLWGCK